MVFVVLERAQHGAGWEAGQHTIVIYGVFRAAVVQHGAGSKRR